MRLQFKQNYISIEQFDPVELTDFTVLTGVNGSGKSHLLGAIEQGKVIIAGMEQASIVHFNYETFRLDNESACSAQQVISDAETAWKFYQQKVQQVATSWKAAVGGEYLTIKDECKSNNRSLWSIGRQAISGYKESTKKFFRSNNEMKNNQQAQGIFSLVKKLPYSLDEINHEEFTSLYKPYVFKKDFLPMQLGRVIWAYYFKYLKNQINKFENEKIGKSHEVLSDSEFINAHGEAPWVLINKIMERFDTLDYKVNSPEGMGYFDQYQLKLVHTRTPNLSLDFSSLSSGERILMALVASIYKSTSDNHFPDVLLLDEVDASLHPSMMRNMLEVIQDIFLKQGIKVILVSHSPTTIALSPDESIYLMNKTGRNRIEKRSKKEALAILTEGFATLNDIEPDLSIEYNLSKTDLPVLFTEGITDKIIIETAWHKLYPKKSMPFYIQDCFDASFLANLFRRGYDGQDGIFQAYSDKTHIALFDFDCEGYNAWNSLSKLPDHVETDPKNGLLKCNVERSGFALLLPVPNNADIEKQVIKEGCKTFENKAVLSIELLFYGHPELDDLFVKETILGGGEIIVFKGQKRKFASMVIDLDVAKFDGFIRLFDKLESILALKK